MNTPLNTSLIGSYNPRRPPPSQTLTRLRRCRDSKGEQGGELKSRRSAVRFRDEPRRKSRKTQSKSLIGEMRFLIRDTLRYKVAAGLKVEDTGGQKFSIAAVNSLSFWLLWMAVNAWKSEAWVRNCYLASSCAVNTPVCSLSRFLKSHWEINVMFNSNQMLALQDSWITAILTWKPGRSILKTSRVLFLVGWKMTGPISILSLFQEKEVGATFVALWGNEEKLPKGTF